jgi:IS30 family transposase
MKKASSFGFYPLPDEATLQVFAAQIEERKRARRRDRKSKLFLYLPLIRYCIDRKMSLRTTCEILEETKQLKVNASTLCRFVKKHPLLKVTVVRATLSDEKTGLQHGI